MTRPFSIDKFRKNITKSIAGIGVGFNDPTDWISTNSYALNYLISGDFNKGFALGKVAILAGEPGAGKSLLMANVIKNAQDQGIFVFVIDTENALDESWLKAFKVDTSENKMLKINASMIDDIGKTINDFMVDYKAMDDDDRKAFKVLFIIDSLTMALTATDVKQFADGDMKGDLGRKAKALKSLVQNCVNMFGSYNVGMACTAHTYASQNMYQPDDIISGGNGPIFAASMVVAMKKGKLKEDEDGAKTSDVSGIRAMCKVMKTRYSKPFEDCELKIPYDEGLDPYSGLFDLFEKHGALVKDGNSYIFTCEDGSTIKKFRKLWNRNEDGCLDKVMAEIMKTPGGLFKTITDISGNTDGIIETEGEGE